MAAPCRCRLSKRWVYSRSGNSCAPLEKAPRSLISELFMGQPVFLHPWGLAFIRRRRQKWPSKRPMCFSVQEGLERKDGWGALKQRRETRFILNDDSRVPWLKPSPMDDQREKRNWKYSKAGRYEPANICRVNDDKRKQAGKNQGCDQLKEATNQKRTEIQHAKNEEIVSDIQERSDVAITLHCVPRREPSIPLPNRWQ
jgi:hypothetical protein